MRIHCLENVDKALQFLKEQRVHLENMGSHDIVDGNHRLVLGLIWTIILRFQVGVSPARGHEQAAPWKWVRRSGAVNQQLGPPGIIPFSVPFIILVISKSWWFALMQCS